MQQIKVITAEEIDRSDMQAIFEEEVNGALSSGWEIAHLAAVKESVVVLMTRDAVTRLPDTPSNATSANWTFGGRLRWLRWERDLTLTDLSSATGLSISYLSDMERGRTLPTLATLYKLAAAYDMTASNLLRGVEIDDAVAQ